MLVFFNNLMLMSKDLISLFLNMVENEINSY
jgi:hypothetical protein